jgi:hypothetical protein
MEQQPKAKPLSYEWRGEWWSRQKRKTSCRRSCGALQSIRWRHPGERDVAAHLSRINGLRHLAIHTIEAPPRRRGVAIDSVIHQRARFKAQLLNPLEANRLLKAHGEVCPGCNTRTVAKVS